MGARWFGCRSTSHRNHRSGVAETVFLPQGGVAQCSGGLGRRVAVLVVGDGRYLLSNGSSRFANFDNSSLLVVGVTVTPVAHADGNEHTDAFDLFLIQLSPQLFGDQQAR